VAAKPPGKANGSPLPAAAAIALTPTFKLVFISVLSLTILSLLVSLILVLYGRDTEDSKRLIESCSTTWKLGFGAIVGLIGGKAL
jgi:hypothetical protein